MRGALAYAAIPALLAAGAAIVLVTWRRSRRDGLVLLGAMAAANVVVQVIKHPLAWSFPAVESLDPLSGHVGVAGAAAIAWAVTVRRARRSSAVVVAGAVISLVGLGVVLANWHLVAQVVCPFLIVLGAMLIADGLLSPATRSTTASSAWAGAVAVLSGVSLAVAALVVAAGSQPPTDETFGAAFLCLLGVVVGLVSAGMGALVLVAPRAPALQGTAQPELRPVER